MASKRDLTVKKRRITAKEEPLPTAATPHDASDEENGATRSAKKKRSSKKKTAHRRKHGRSVIWAVIFRLLLIAVILILGVLLWQNREHLAPAAVTEWFDRLITGGSSGDGYPLDISGDSVVSMQPFGNQVAVLTDTSLQVYNSTAAETANRTHTYADPLLEVEGDYMLVAELGGTRYTLHTKKECIYEGQVDNAILSAAVSSSGQVALATESSQSYMSEVLVFDRKGEKLFHWYSVDLMVIDVAFHPRQKQIAVLGLSAASGEMRSTLHLFSLSGKETGAAYTYSATGPMMTVVHYFDNERVGLIGDTAVWVYDPSKNETVTVNFEDAALLGYAFSSDGIGIVTRNYGEGYGGTLQHISAVGEVVGTTAFDGDYRHIAAAKDGGFCLLTDNTLYLADKGTVKKQAAVSTDSLMVADMNGKPLILGLSTLTRVAWES